MSKKLFLSAMLSLALVVAMTNGAVFAEEGAMPLNDSNDVMPISEDGDTMPINETGGEIPEPTNDATSGDKIDLEEGDKDSDSNQTPDCDAESDEDCADSEEEGEPELWPMYASLGALGAAVLIFISLNLFGRKKK